MTKSQRLTLQGPGTRASDHREVRKGHYLRYWILWNDGSYSDWQLVPGIFAQKTAWLFHCLC